MPAVFISHSNLDNDFAIEIKANLECLGLEQVFLDFDKVTGINAGEFWEKRLYEEISRCHAIVILITPNWLASKWCFVELAQARALGKIVIPITYESLDSRVLPEIQSIDIYDWNSEGRERLERRLRAISDELARGFHFDPSRYPYPGINNFEAEDAAIFFGRDDETRALIERLDARRTQGGSRLLLLIGASGSGKSSLLKAGVLPQVARRDKEWLLLPTMRPEKSPLEAFAKAIAQHIEKPLTWREWLGILQGDDVARQLIELLRDLRVGNARSTTVLISIDQFEELYTVASPDERIKFFQILASMLDPTNDLPVVVLAAGRSDVLAEMIESGVLAHITETFLLEPLPLDRVPRLIEGPAAIIGLNVERGLAEQMVRDVEIPEALPLLAYTLFLLYQSRGDEKKLTVTKYRALGDAQSGLNPIQNSVRRAADRALSGLHPSAEEYEALRDAFVPHLVRITLDGNKRVRQPAYQSQLPPRSLRLIAALVEARLLSKRISGKRNDATSPHSEVIVEVTHEALFKTWILLDNWLIQEHTFLVDIERIRSAHEIWIQAPDQLKSVALLRGLLLLRAREWLSNFPTRFSGCEMVSLRTFVETSMHADEIDRARVVAQEARTEQIKRWFFRGAVGAASICLVIAIIAVIQYAIAENERKIAKAREIFAISKLEEGVNDECMLALTVAAYDAARQADKIDLLPFENAIHSALARTHVLTTIRGSSRLPQVSWNSDSTQLAFIDDEGKIQFWFDKTKRVGSLFYKNANGARSVEWIPSSKKIAVVHKKGIDLVDSDSGELVKTLDLPNLDLVAIRFDHAGKRALAWSWTELRTLLIDFEKETVQAFKWRTNGWRGYAWSPDDKLVAIAADNSVWFIDLTESKVERIKLSEIITSLAWSPDGTYLVTGHDSGRMIVWDAREKNQVQVLDGHSNQITSLDFSQDGKKLASASQDYSMRIWDVGSWRMQQKLTGHSSRFESLRWNTSGALIATTDAEGTVRIWSPADSRSSELLMQTEGWVWSAEWGHDNSLIAFAADSEVVFRDHSGIVHRMAEPNGQYRAGNWSTSSSRYAIIDNRNLIIIDAATRNVLMTQEVESDPQLLLGVALSPKGDMVAVTSTKDVRVYSVPNGELKWRIGSTSPAAAFSPDGTLLALVPVGGTTVEIVDISDGKQYISLEGLPQNKATWALRWNPNGNYIATGSDDRLTRVWKLTSPEKPIDIMYGHDGEVKGIAWNKKGNRLATASMDKTVRVWDMVTGKLLATLSGHVSGVRSVAWSFDDKKIITGSEDGTSRLFLTNFADTLAIARAQTEIGLTTTEQDRCVSRIGVHNNLVH